jgi:chromosomal replication initiation ATPase DnaA
MSYFSTPQPDALMERLSRFEARMVEFQKRLASFERQISTRTPRAPKLYDDARKTIGEIQLAIARHYEISVQKLVSKDRHEEIVWPRHLAIYLSRQLTNAPSQMVGEMFGDRDHGTVLHAVKAVEARKKTNAVADAEVRYWLEIVKEKQKTELTTDSHK